MREMIKLKTGRKVVGEEQKEKKRVERIRGGGVNMTYVNQVPVESESQILKDRSIVQVR